MSKKRNQRQKIDYEHIIMERQSEISDVPVDIPIDENEVYDFSKNDNYVSDDKKLINDGIIDVLPDETFYENNSDALNESFEGGVSDKPKVTTKEEKIVENKPIEKHDITEDNNDINKKKKKLENHQLPQSDVNSLPTRNSNKQMKMASKKAVIWFDWTGSIVLAMVVSVIIFVFMFRIFNVNGDSMLNTLQNNDRVVLSNLYSSPKVGDIVVISRGTNLDKRLVKRVIALQGQIIDIDPLSGMVTVDNVVLDEEYIKDLTTVIYDVEFPLEIPEGYAFVMGDNRLDSKDSRDSDVGLIKMENIIGTASAVVYPFDRFKLFS